MVDQICRKAFKRLDNVAMMLSLLSSAAPPPPPPPSLTHFMTSFYFILFYYNKDSPTEHSSDRGDLHMTGGRHKVICANEKKREKKRNQGSSSEQCHFHFHFFIIFDNINKKKQPFLINLCLERHAMPVTGVRMPTNYPQDGH